MIVIHIDSQKDTAFLKICYEGLDNVKLLYNPSRADIDKTLRDNPNEDVMMLGHGSPTGLFGTDWRGWAIDASNAKLLKDRNCIGIWCYAKDFGRNFGLKGYFTSMFVSNASEARCHHFKGTDEEIFAEVEVFAKAVNELIKNGTPYEDWVDSLQSGADMSKDFVKYNYENMEYFDGTQKAPAKDFYSMPLWAGEDTIIDEYSAEDFEISKRLIDADEVDYINETFDEFIKFQYPNATEQEKTMMHDAFLFGWMQKDDYLNI